MPSFWPAWSGRAAGGAQCAAAEGQNVKRICRAQCAGHSRDAALAPEAVLQQGAAGDDDEYLEDELDEEERDGREVGQVDPGRRPRPAKVTVSTCV